jgi:two-component system, cell cycle response regulator
MAGEKILAIDDEISYRTLYNDLLSQEGYVVQLAKSAEMALRLRAKERFDLMIVDHPMEGISGIHFVEIVREEDPLLPVVVVGPQDSQAAMDALKKGATDYINKPLNPGEFKASVRTILGRSKLLQKKAFAISEGLEQHRFMEVFRKGTDILLTVTGDAALQSVLELALDETKASKGFVLWREKDSPQFTFRAQKGLLLPQGYADAVTSGQGILGALLSKASPAILGPVLEEEAGSAYLGRTSTLILPVERRKEILGALILGDKSTQEPFTQADIRVLMPITSLIPLLFEGGTEQEAESEESERISLDFLPDQATFEALAEKELKKAQRYRRSFSLILINMDRLLSFLNESVPLARKEILRQVTESLLSTIRGADIAALMKNGEIGLLVPETNYHGAIVAARRIRQAVRDLQILRGLSLPSPSPIVFGIASFPEHGVSKDELLNRGRLAMTRSAENAYRFENLWGYIDKLLSEARITSELIRSLSWARERKEEDLPSSFQETDQLLPTGEHVRELQFVPSWEDFQIFSQYIEDNVLERLAGEGILFAAVRDRSSLEPKLERYHRMTENGIKVFVFSQEDWQDWGPKDIAPVVTEDPTLTDYAFTIYYGVSSCYCLVGRQRGKEAMCGFFTISDVLVNEIIKKLNETYL